MVHNSKLVLCSRVVSFAYMGLLDGTTPTFKPSNGWTVKVTVLGTSNTNLDAVIQRSDGTSGTSDSQRIGNVLCSAEGILTAAAVYPLILQSH